MDRLKNLILYGVYKGFSLVARALPDRGQQYLGLALGRLVYHLPENRRQLAFNNMKQALGGDYSINEIKQKVRGVYDHLGQMLVEFILTERLDQDYIDQHIKITGLDNLEQAYSRGQGVILYSAHFGNWEWMGSLIPLLGYPMTAIVKPQHNPYFDQAITELRQYTGSRVIATGFSLRQAYQTLKNGDCLFVLGDQDARSQGWKLDFLGRPASTYGGVVKLARRTGAAIVPMFMVRQGWGQHHLQFLEPRWIGAEAGEERQLELLQELTGIVEGYIREYPEQWFWLHRRWKTY
ncbi:MAG: lysophospholipid acyltransferase family protein [Bacillota bacterium]